MLKNKKVIISLIVVILIIIIAILANYIYTKSRYSLENVQAMLDSAKSDSNVHISEEYKGKENPNTTTVATVDTYMKDNLYYVTQKNVDGEVILESFGNTKEQKRVDVIHTDQTIVSSTIAELEEGTNSNFLILSKNATAEYEYIGKETINGKQCIKVSITNEYNDKVEKIYYYIDLEDNRIIKLENYTGNNIKELEQESEVTYTYSYNTVQDKDILSFDINNYPNYEYRE